MLCPQDQSISKFNRSPNINALKTIANESSESSNTGGKDKEKKNKKDAKNAFAESDQW
jgi:hypothetical protein